MRRFSFPSRARPERHSRLTFKEKAELAGLPSTIDSLERERDAIYASLADPAFLRNGAAVVAARERIGVLDADIAAKSARWEELETIAAIAAE